MSIHGFAEFRGIDASRFYNAGELVSFSKINNSGFVTTTEDQTKAVNFAIVNPSDLRPRGVQANTELTQYSLLEKRDTFHAVILYSDSLFDFIKQDQKVKLKWKQKLYTIKSCTDLNDHKVYILLEIVRRSFRNG